MKDTRSNQSRPLRKLPQGSSFAAKISDENLRQSGEQITPRRTPDQLKKIVAEQTSLQWTKIIAFPQRRARTIGQHRSVSGRTDPNSK